MKELIVQGPGQLAWVDHHPQVVGCEDAPQALIQPLTKCIVVRERIT